MQQQHGEDRAAASVRTLEFVVSALLFIFGAVVIWDSARIGARWGDDGPQAGYFPFYVGLFICLASLAIFAIAAFKNGLARKTFVTTAQLKLVLVLLVPSVIYVALIDGIGIYEASTLFIAFFMLRLGKYSWLKTVPVALGVSIVFFALFEIWFKVPLPKGPIEALLGFR